MTTKAISCCGATIEGFFLQVEGASIDKQDHAANACGQIGETVDLDEAVQAALRFAQADGNTSVFVTADHAHTSQIVEAGSTTPGLTVNLLTDGRLADDDRLRHRGGRRLPAAHRQSSSGSPATDRRRPTSSA